MWKFQEFSATHSDLMWNSILVILKPKKTAILTILAFSTFWYFQVKFFQKPKCNTYKIVKTFYNQPELMWDDRANYLVIVRIAKFTYTLWNIHSQNSQLGWPGLYKWAYLLCWPVLVPQITGEPLNEAPPEDTEKLSLEQSPTDPPVAGKIRNCLE